MPYFATLIIRHCGWYLWRQNKTHSKFIFAWICAKQYALILVILDIFWDLCILDLYYFISSTGKSWIFMFWLSCLSLVTKGIKAWWIFLHCFCMTEVKPALYTCCCVTWKKKKKKSSLPSHRGNPRNAVLMSASAKCKTKESQQMDIYVDGWIVHLICNHLIKAFVSIFIFVFDGFFFYILIFQWLALSKKFPNLSIFVNIFQNIFFLNFHFRLCIRQMGP